MRIQIDKDLCIGCEACVELIPDILEMVDDVAAVSVEVIPEDLEEEAVEAAEACPTGAILIEED